MTKQPEQRLTALEGIPSQNDAQLRMGRDTPPEPLVAALMFGELMAAGRRAAVNGPGDLAGAAATVRAVIPPLWPRVTPEAARDVLVACAELAVAQGVTGLPGESGDITAGDMLELAAGHAAAGSPPAGGLAPHVAYASSAAFDREEDAAVLDSVCLLLVLAHPASDIPPGGWPEENESWPIGCPECGGDDPQGTYGCSCFDPGACSECGAYSGDCDCWA
jgi:hypothetical protein